MQQRVRLDHPVIVSPALFGPLTRSDVHFLSSRPDPLGLVGGCEAAEMLARRRPPTVQLHARRLGATARALSSAVAAATRLSCDNGRRLPALRLHVRKLAASVRPLSSAAAAAPHTSFDHDRHDVLQPPAPADVWAQPLGLLEAAAAAAGQPERKLCSMGTGEVVHIMAYQAKDEAAVPDFERLVQCIARRLHELEAGVSDVRVCHPKCGEATFVVTFVSAHESERFKREVAPRIADALRPVSLEGGSTFSRAGTLMPQAHTLSSLLAKLQQLVRGRNYREHDIAAVQREVGKWFPRRSEYAQYVHWDEQCPKKYTRNLVYSSDEMEVLLMCWLPGARSLIHCHDESSCWVAAVEGQVHEVQFGMPKMDRMFFKNAMTNPNGAIGRCGPLKMTNVTVLGQHGSPTGYANNDVGLHRIENRSPDQPAITLHVYAPRLERMTIFKEAGDHSVASIAAVQYTSEGGKRTGRWGRDTDPDGIIDSDAWNRVEEVPSDL